MNTLFLIPARGGSKGIPYKNIKKLNNIPLIHYSIDLAREFISDKNICVSTDDKKIVSVAREHRLEVPFMRPKSLATDTAGTYEVLLHAIEWHKKKGFNYDRIVLLQPTSPFRLKKHLESALACYSDKTDMVVSVKKAGKNPYAVLYKSKSDGFIQRCFPPTSKGERRQDSDEIFELNGAVYIFNVKSLLKKRISDFKNIKMVEMGTLNSVDIDNPVDWEWCEFLLAKKKVKLDYKVTK